MPDDRFNRGQERERSRPGALHGVVVIGTVVAVDELGPVLAYSAMPDARCSARAAESTVRLSPDDVGTSVALGFAEGDPARPLVLGRLDGAEPGEQPSSSAPVVIADGHRLRVEAEHELVLCCGAASITLRANGRLVIRGDYVETRARGVNRIRGGSVAIN